MVTGGLVACMIGVTIFAILVHIMLNIFEEEKEKKYILKKVK